MSKILQRLFNTGSITGSIGALISTMGCAMCFPAIASFASAIGLGFLGQWEMVFLNTWLPFFAWFVLALNLFAWFAHKQFRRTLLMVVGPILLLLSYYPWFQYAWSSYVTYFALILMVVTSIWDLGFTKNRSSDAIN
jgi:mercuric ion transport protein